MSNSGTPTRVRGRESRTHGASGDAFVCRSWSNWILLAATFLITTVGLGLVIATLLPNRLVSPWPWVRTDVTLVCACLLLVTTLVLHLTREQRNLNRMNAEIQRVESEANAASRRRMYGLLNVSRIMGVHNKPEAVFDGITASCVEAFQCDRASLMLYDDKTRELVVRSASGHGDVSHVIGATQPIGEGIAGWVAEHKKALILGREREVKENPELKLNSPSVVAAMVVPIILRDELVGVINVSSQSPGDAYRDDDLQALQVFAENAGVCIRHAEQAEWMRQTTEHLRRQAAKVNEPTSA
jgi:transcriptional regulator with GAF, ATPase, and Fis domain